MSFALAEKTVFTFNELSDAAKERARDHYRDHNQDHGWWEYTYEDAITCASKLGIEIGTRTVKLQDGSACQDPLIWFSGFSSQGDGASYEGHYSPAPNAVKDIVEHAPQDRELKTIAEDLTLLQITSRIRFGHQLCARITTSGHYHHSGTMEVAAMSTSDGEIDVPNDLDKNLTVLLRRFADWIYHQLKVEDEYLNSDECIDQNLAEDEFDEDGAVI